MKFIAQLNIAKGFSLVEVLLTTVVLGVGLVGVASFQGKVMKESSLSKQRIEAINFAENKLENLRHFSSANEWETKVLSSLSGTEELNGVSNPGTTFTLTYEIDPDPEGVKANIAVKVDWPDSTKGDTTPTASEDTTVYLSTIVSNTTPVVLASAAGATLVSDKIILPTYDPTDPGTFCKCGTKTTKTTTTTTTTTTASADLLDFDSSTSPYIKVGGMSGGMSGGGSSSPTTTTSTSTDVQVTYSYNPTGPAGCDECCKNLYPAEYAAYASNSQDQKHYAVNSQDQKINTANSQEQEYYAAVASVLKEFFEERGYFQKSKYEDRVIGGNGFNPDYLQKGYNTTNWDAINNFWKTMGGMMGGGSSSGGSTTTTTDTTVDTVTADDFALCTYYSEATTTTSSTSSSTSTSSTTSTTASAPKVRRGCAKWTN